MSYLPPIITAFRGEFDRPLEAVEALWVEEAMRDDGLPLDEGWHWEGPRRAPTGILAMTPEYVEKVYGHLARYEGHRITVDYLRTQVLGAFEAAVQTYGPYTDDVPSPASNPAQLRHFLDAIAAEVMDAVRDDCDYLPSEDKWANAMRGLK